MHQIHEAQTDGVIALREVRKVAERKEARSSTKLTTITASQERSTSGASRLAFTYFKIPRMMPVVKVWSLPANKIMQ